MYNDCEITKNLRNTLSFLIRTSSFCVSLTYWNQK